MADVEPDAKRVAAEAEAEAEELPRDALAQLEEVQARLERLNEASAEEILKVSAYAS